MAVIIGDEQSVIYEVLVLSVRAQTVATTYLPTTVVTTGVVKGMEPYLPTLDDHTINVTVPAAKSCHPV